VSVNAVVNAEDSCRKPLGGRGNAPTSTGVLRALRRPVAGGEGLDCLPAKKVIPTFGLRARFSALRAHAAVSPTVFISHHCFQVWIKHWLHFVQYISMKPSTAYLVFSPVCLTA